MATTGARARLGSRGAPDASKAAILQAAIKEFAREGVAGARIDAIAHAAKVNKALLYYYYIDKEKLYAVTLDYVFQKRSERLMSVLQLDLPPGEKVLRYVSVFFDYLAEYPYHRQVVQREMLALDRRPQMRRAIVRYVKPLFVELAKVIEAGIASGVFRPVDPMQFIPMMGAIVMHYFGSAPLLKLVTKEDPLRPDKLAARRAAMLDFISAALFARTGVEEGSGV